MKWKKNNWIKNFMDGFNGNLVMVDERISELEDDRRNYLEWCIEKK